MSAADENTTHGTVTKQSQGRYRVKSEGRAAFMRELNAKGLAGRGGRPLKSGEFALAERLSRGLDAAGPLAILHAERRTRYVGDLGGEENCSAMELRVCDRLADLDLLRGLLNVQRDASKRMSLTKLEAFAAAVSRNAVAYLQAVKTIGPGRRAKDADRTVVVRRWSAAEPDTKPTDGNGQEQEQGGGK